MYPHWDALLGGGQSTTAATFSKYAAAVTSHGKVFIVNEFGWDRTDWKTADELQHVLDTITHDPNISGDDFWALQAHLDNFGFQPIPADSHDLDFCEKGECGEWWALYYPGIRTSIMPAAEMASRAQQLPHPRLRHGRPARPETRHPSCPCRDFNRARRPRRLARLRRSRALLHRPHGPRLHHLEERLRQVRHR